MSHHLSIQASADRVLTPAQRKFNQLVQKIELARAELLAWQEQLPLFVQGHATRARPLLAEIAVCQRQLVDRLDAMLPQRHWTKAERQTMVTLLCEVAGTLLDGDALDEADHVRLKALYDKHADVDFDTDNRESLAAMKGLFETVTGMDLGDEAFESEEAMLQHARERMRADHEAAAQAAPQPRKARQTAAQRRREAEAQEASQSVREVYRKLASALHPDRAADDADRTTRTALMQRVNQAYDAKDLLALYALQLEIEQVDAAHLAQATAERAKHYNQVLSAQLVQLQQEVQSCQFTFVGEFGQDLGLDPLQRVQVKSLGKLLNRHVAELLASVHQAKRELNQLADPKLAKRWLKLLRQQQQEMDDDDLFF